MLCSKAEVLDNVITNTCANREGLLGLGIGAIDESEVIIQGNLLHQNTELGICICKSKAEISNNATIGIQANSDGVFRFGIIVEESFEMAIESNTLDLNSAHGIYIISSDRIDA